MIPKIGDKIKITLSQQGLIDIGFNSSLYNKIATIIKIKDGNKYYIDEDSGTYLVKKEFIMASWRNRYGN